MKNSSKRPSSSPYRGRSEKPNLRSSKSQCNDPIQLSSKTPEKPLERTRTRNRGVALSISDIRKVAKGLQDRNKPSETTSLPPARTARRQISLPSPRKPNTAADQPFKLPEKYEILGEFFDCLDSSIRLMRLKRSMASFTNIKPKVESLTDRRFTHGHLAQLKFILPEAIDIKKLLLFDERTNCMKPDLLVTLNPDAIESDTKLPERGTSWLRKLFRERLRDFCKSHPQGDEIPEEALPEPFSRPKLDHPLNLLNGGNADEHLSMPVETPIEVLNQQQPALASYMSQGFRRHFSLKSKKNVADNVEQKLLSDSSQLSALPVSDSSLKINSTIEVTKSHSKPSQSVLASEAVSSGTCSTIHASSVCFTSSGVTPATPIKTTIEFTEIKDGSLKKDVMSTPAKPLSTPTRLMTATPALPLLKRPHMTPDDNCTSSPLKLVRGPSRSRSLKFDTQVESEDAAAVGGLSNDDDISDILSDNLLQSLSEKERKAMEERDPAISQAKKRKKIIASLPKLFNMIHLLFHSRNRSVITKEELISKILSGHSDIIDRSEVEEQLHLLLELVPEWISEKLSLSGDMLFCINKMLNPHTIRTSLEEAK